MGKVHNDINPHTGAELITPVPTDAFRKGWELIWGNKQEPIDEHSESKSSTDGVVSRDNTDVSSRNSDN